MMFKYCILIVLIFLSSLLAQVDDTVSVTIDSLLQIQIEPQKHIESASKYSQSLEDAPSSVSIINSGEIEIYGYQTLAELLNSQVGFYISDDRNYTYLGMRGFSRPTDYNNRVLLLIDGHRLNDYIYDAAIFGRELGLGVNNFERVEIIRGPGSALYGTSAMFAVINLIPKRLNNLLAPDIKLSYGSYNTKTISLNAGQQFDNSVSISFNGSYINSTGEDIYFNEFDNPETNNGLATGRDYGEHYGLFGTFCYKNFKLQGLSTHSKKGVPTASWGTDFNEDLHTIDNFHFIEANIFHNFSYNTEASLRVYFDKYYYWGVYTYEGENSFDDDNGETVGAEAKFIWDILPNNRLTSGVEYKNILKADYKFWDEYEVYNVFDDPYKLLSVYLQDEFQLISQLSFYVGLRDDYYVDIENSLNPRFGVIYTPLQNHTFKLLYGRAFRAPNAYERKYEDPLYGFKTNPYGLSPEKAHTYEFIWNYKISRLITSSTSLFYYKITDLIDQIEDPEDEFLYFSNFGKTETYGTEISIDATLTNYSSLYIRYSYQNAKDENSNRLSNSPLHMLKFGLFHKIISPINFSFEYQYESKRSTVYETETEPIHLAKLNVFTNPILGKFKFSFLVKNLFNNTIKYPGGWEQVQTSIVQPGRNYTFTISYSGF